MSITSALIFQSLLCFSTLLLSLVCYTIHRLKGAKSG